MRRDAEVQTGHRACLPVVFFMIFNRKPYFLAKNVFIKKLN
jgi:hypothetical protein